MYTAAIGESIPIWGGYMYLAGGGRRRPHQEQTGEEIAGGQRATDRDGDMIQRQINKMRQLATHGPGRSQDVIDLLPEDLLPADQQVEVVKRAAHLVGKRLASCMQAPLGSDMDKRLRKLALMSLSLAMADGLKEMESESSLRRTLEMGCCVEASLAQSLVEFEINMERDVLQPLSKLSEEELPSVLKRRKQLQKSLTDWNSAKTRLSQAQKNMSAGQGGSGTGTPAKLESLREEEDELRRRVEQSKDDYLSDLYHFATKENDYRNYFIRLLELQAEYHRRSLAQLIEALGELRDTLKESGPSLQAPADVYGVPLATHLAKFSCEIAVPISACVRMLLTHGMQEEGLFRLAAGASVLKRLKARLGAGTRDLEEFVAEPHAMAGALKSYLRELPEPLMTFELFDDWMKAASIKEAEKRPEGYREVCAKLPPENYHNLRYLVKFLAKLAEHQEINKMTPSNIAIVLGPNLLWAPSNGDSSVLDMASASSLLVVTVAEGLISCATDVFPGDVDFGVSEESSNPAAASFPQAANVQPIPASPMPPYSPTLPPSQPPRSDIRDGEEIRRPESAPESTSTGQGPEEASPGMSRKGKRPAPLRPNMAPPVQPREVTTSIPQDGHANPRPIPRRNIGGSLRVPNMPPPHPPSVRGSSVNPEPCQAEPPRNAPPRPTPRSRVQSTDK